MTNLAEIKNSENPDIKFDNRYRLKEKIGGGGFSEVWLAHDTNADIDVALKIYTPNGELDEEGKEDFKREFARLCGLNHSNIIHAIGFGIHDDELPYLAMNVCRNGSAKALIGHYEEEQLWTFIEQVALGLQYLHAHDITHQDIKPDNILMNSDGQYLIIDFGISTKTRNTLRRPGRKSVSGGTPWYMSNESFGTQSSDIHARDIWAFGATLYEIVTGDVPFGQYGGISQKAQDGKVPPISADVSCELKQLIYDCLAFEAWDRPDADEIIRRVREHREGKGGKSGKGRRKTVSGTIALVLISLCCYIGYTNLPSSEKPADHLPTVNKNDSIYLSKIHEAMAITRKEKDKGDAASVDEHALRSAAAIVSAARHLEVTDSVRRQCEKMWSSEQKMIDDTYDYLCRKSREYAEIGAEEASRNFLKRSSLLTDYVTPSRVAGKKAPPSPMKNSLAQTRKAKSIQIISKI